MELKDFMPLIAVLIASFFAFVGWIINSRLNRKHEIFKKALDYRLEMYKSWVDVWLRLEKTHGKWNLDSGLGESFSNSRVLFILYGTNEEYNKMESFVEALLQEAAKEYKSQNLDYVNKTKNEIHKLAMGNYRKALNLEQLIIK